METFRLKRIWRAGLVLGVAVLSAGCDGDGSDSTYATGSVASGDGVTIVYDVAGEGTPALVFVHGWSCDRTYWEEQLEPFSHEFTVVAVDLAGHGESGLDRDEPTIEAFGGDVAAVVEGLGLERVVLIGHSMGGDVIMEAARQLPGRVTGLVWVDTYKRLPVFRTDEELETMLAPFRVNFVETTRDMVRGMFSSSADAHEIPAALEELSLPVVAINADNEPTDIASMERHGVDVVVMPGVGHFPMMEDPARFNQTLRNAVEGFAR